MRLLFLTYLSFVSLTAFAQQPNIVYILADDLGIGDLSAYNSNSKVRTPNIDMLAKNGAMFTDAHSGSSVCTPTRYGILTGRYSWRGVLKKGVTWSYDSCIIEENRPTVATFLGEQGYQTACIGKWHLGLDWSKPHEDQAVDFKRAVKNSPNEHGFSYSYIIPASLDIPPYVYLENGKLTSLPNRTTVDSSTYGWWREGPTGEDFEHTKVLPKLFEKAKAFMQEKSDKPKFLYLPLTAPHTPILPDNTYETSFPYLNFVGMIDRLIGEFYESLPDKQNTIIIITSDNGCAPYAGVKDLEMAGHYASLHFRGYKADIYEGGHRVPYIMYWPNKIEQGQSISETTCLTDLSATLAEILQKPLTPGYFEDSYSIWPLLVKEEYRYQRKYTIHHSVNGTFAIRSGSWKLILSNDSGGWSFPKPSSPDVYDTKWQLYDLASDPSEKKNLYNTHPEKVKQLLSLQENQTYH